MKLFTTDGSPFGARVRIQIYYKDLPVEILPPPGDFGSEALKAINPLGKIPVLETEGNNIIESEVIQEYLQAKFPTPSMLGESAGEAATIRTLSRLTDLYLLAALMPLHRAMKDGAGLQDDGAEVSTELQRVLRVLDQLMTGKRYAVSDHLSLADCALAPLFFYLERFSQKLELPLELSDCEFLHPWWQNIRNDDTVARVIGEIEASLS